jgi:DUF4097 and DUF4098 domain-containing protein YvlB
MRLRLGWRRAGFAFAAVCLLTLGGGRAAFAGEDGHFDRTLSVSGGVDLDVQTGSGDISVRPGESGKVVVRGVIHVSGWHGGDAAEVKSIEDNPPIQQEGNSIRIGRVEDRDWLRHISISYEIQVPKETKVRSKTGSGEDHVEGVAGPVEALSGSGSVRVHEIGSEVHAGTGSGEIDAANIQGRTQLSSGSGTIRATGIAGAFSASTGSGSVRFEQTAPGDVEISTGSGDLELEHVKGGVRATSGSGSIRADGEPSGPWRIHTSSGDLKVKMPASAAFDLAAHLGSGSIQSALEIIVEGALNSHELRGKVRGGGPLVELSTSSGTIAID